MENLESQISKIQLGGTKNARNFVYVSAEKAQGSEAEIYIIVELPLLNPAAEESCMQIALSIFSAMKRAYKKPASDELFETAISQVNEELGKLATMGQTQWVNKLNALIAVKSQNSLTICSCGKIAAFLLRKEELTDISCSAPEPHPLRTFENFASGKIVLDDLIIFSANQLFNYIAIDRLKNILTEQKILVASRTIIELLKQNAGPEVAFGILLNLQVPINTTHAEEVDLQNYNIEEKKQLTKIFQGILTFFRNSVTFKYQSRTPKTELPNITLPPKEPVRTTASSSQENWWSKIVSVTRGVYEGLKNIRYTSKKIFGAKKNLTNLLSKSVIAGKDGLNTLNTFSKEKKFFLVSAFILFVVLIGSISVSWKYKQIEKQRSGLNQSLEKIRKTLSDAQSSILYNDQKTAVALIKQIKNELPQKSGLTKAQIPLFEQVISQIDQLTNKLERVEMVEAINVGNLSFSENLIKIPNFLATQIKGNVTISYDKATGKIQDGVLTLPENVVITVPLPGNKIVTYQKNGKLQVWDTTTNKGGSVFEQNVPSFENFVGLAYYPTNQRVYLARKDTQQILSFAVINEQLSRPIVSTSGQADISQSVSLAVDGHIYLLHKNGVKKLLSGKSVEFGEIFPFENFSGKGKIYTDTSMKYLYILDSGNKKIIISDKKGAIVSTLKSPQFLNPLDMEINEKDKFIFVLDEERLLKIPLP